MQIRPRGYIAPVYGEEQYFTMKLHHGGKLVEHPLKMYVGGNIDFIDYTHFDTMSLVELDKLAEKLGYVGGVGYFYLQPRTDFQTGLVFVLSDDNALDMAKIGAKFGEISLYMVEPFLCGLLEDIDKVVEEIVGAGAEGANGGIGGMDTGVRVDFDMDRQANAMDTEAEGLQAEGATGDIEGMDIGVRVNFDKDRQANGMDTESKGLQAEGGCDTGEASDDDINSSDGEVLFDSDYDLSEDDDMLYDTYVNPEFDCSDVRSKEKEKMQEQVNTTLFDVVDIEVQSELDNSSSDELQSICSDEENEGVTKYIRFNPKIDMQNPIFRNGMVFTDAKEFKAAVRSHAVHWQRNIGFIKNDTKRVRAKCKGKNCPWVILASKMSDSTTFQIRTLNINHKCGRTLAKNKFVTSKLLSQKYKNDWRLNNGWRVSEFQEKVHNDLNCEISRSQYYRTRRKVNDMLNGHFTDQYARLWDYTEELKKSNPNSTVVMKTEVDEKTGDERFLRLYICFDACRKGFMEACRPVIGVDGCHLRGTHKGILLTAVGLDPNNCIFPICFCVCEGEDKQTWKWFLELLIDDVAIYDQQKWTIVSDRQKGLLPALFELLPDIEHRFCVWHMYNNFKKEHPGLALKDRVWNLARASTINQFNFQMDSLKDLDEGAHQWLSEVLPTHWSRSHFRTSPKCDILLNNLCESFNSAILEARNKPFLSMVEALRVYLMKRLQSKRDCMTKWTGDICPKILKRMEKLKDATRGHISTYAGAGKFEVRDMYGQYKVDLMQQSCSCRRWDLCGIPCVHAMSAIMSASREPEEYVNSCYSINAHQRAYGHVINPVSGPSEWPNSGKGPIAPPNDIRLPGRPRKMRIREVGEPPASANGTQKLSRSYQKTVKCKKCGKSGHNKAKCTGSRPVPPPAAQSNPNPTIHAPPNSAQSVPTPATYAQPAVGPDVDHIAATQPVVQERAIPKKRRCSVCLHEGHYRSKCPYPAGKMWKNYDRYAFNVQTNPVSEAPNAPNVAPRPNASERISQRAIFGASVSEGASACGVESSTRGASGSANIGGVPIKASFLKKGKHCVTLKSLQTAAKSRSLKASTGDIGQSTQQSSSTAKTTSRKKKD